MFLNWLRSKIIIFMYFVGFYFSVSVVWKLIAWVLKEPYTLQMSNYIIAFFLSSALAQLVIRMGYREEVEDYDV